MNTTRLYLAILRALNIRQEERKYVLHLFLHYFFRALPWPCYARWLTRTFLAHYPINSLPVVYVLAAVMLATGRLYACLEHHLPL